jgi:hypothetical protein
MKQAILYICFAGLCGNSLSQTVPARPPGHKDDTAINPSRLRDTSLLHAVTVVGRKTLVKPTLDGFIYQADNDITIAAGSAIDVLRRMPLVTIGIDGTPGVQGRNSVRVYIDNKPSELYAASVADALRLIAAEDIESVELITQPSARFDAEGTDAVINIITKKNRYNGLNGRLNVVVGNRTVQGGASVKWRKGKLILSLDGNWYRYNNTFRYLLERTTSDNIRLQQQKDNKNIWNTYVASSTITWLIDSQQTVSAGYRFRTVSERAGTVLNAMYHRSDSILANTRQIDNHFDNGVHTLNAVYTGISRNKKRELNFQVIYFFNRENAWYDLEQWQHAKLNHIEKSNSQNANNELSVQADWLQSFGTAFKLETGLKTFWRQSRSENAIDLFDFVQGHFTLDPIRSNHFDYDRSIYAGYASGMYAWKSWTIRFGLRYEQTHLQTRFKDTALRIPDYNNWVPNFLISTMLGKDHTLKFSYSKKIIRPYFGSLNPTINYIDSFNIEYGNPALLPIGIHNWQLVYQFNRNKLLANVSLFADYRNNDIGQIRLLKRGIVEATYGNIARNLAYGANAHISFDDNRHVSGGAGIIVKYVTLKSPALQLSNSGWMVQPNGRFSYRFNKTLQVETTVTYYPPYVRLQGWSGDWFFYNFVISKKWWNDKLLASWSMDNFFTRYQHSNEVFETDLFHQTIKNRYPVMFMKLGLTYKFGKKEIGEPARRGGSEEE